MVVVWKEEPQVLSEQVSMYLASIQNVYGEARLIQPPSIPEMPAWRQVWRDFRPYFSNLTVVGLIVGNPPRGVASTNVQVVTPL